MLLLLSLFLGFCSLFLLRCTRIGIMAHGRLEALGTTTHLQSTVSLLFSVLDFVVSFCSVAFNLY